MVLMSIINWANYENDDCTQNYISLTSDKPLAHKFHAANSVMEK